MAIKLQNDFGGVVPDDIELLQTLPGVGRKTANVIASVVFDKPAMAVDTHVFRVAARIGLVKNAKTPLATELQLVKHLPEHIIPKAHHWLILHGRYVCKARTPLCSQCGITSICDWYKNILPKPETNFSLWCFRGINSYFCLTSKNTQYVKGRRCSTSFFWC